MKIKAHMPLTPFQCNETKLQKKSLLKSAQWCSPVGMYIISASLFSVGLYASHIVLSYT